MEKVTPSFKDTTWTGPYSINDEVAIVYGNGMLSKGIINSVTSEGIELTAVNYASGQIEDDNTIWLLRHAVQAISPHDSKTCDGCQARRGEQGAEEDVSGLASLLDTAPDPNSEDFGEWVKGLIKP